MGMSLAEIRVIDPILSTVVQGFRQADLVGENLFPRVTVLISGGQILEFGKESFRKFETLRVPGAVIKRVGLGYLGKPFSLRNHALAGNLPTEHLRDAKVQPGIDLGQRALSLPMKILLRQLEEDQADLALNAGNYDINHKIALTGGDKWSDDLSVPAKQIQLYREAVRASIGLYPNVLVLSAQAFGAIRENPSILDRFKYTSKESVTPELLAALLDFEKVVVGKAIKEDASGNLVDVWGNNAVLAYVPSNPSGMEEPSYGYTYVMTGHPMTTVAYYDQNSNSWIYPVHFERAPVLSGITAAFLVQNPK